jgi:triosephosphate isomerase
MRTVILTANLKMHKTAAETAGYASALVRQVADLTGVEIVIAPPFTALDRSHQSLAGGAVKLAAQDVHAESEGPFTGEISVAMLAELGCAYSIVGHSERRALFGETDARVSEKVSALLAGGLRPIVCVGESLEDRKAGRTQEVVETQLRRSLLGVEPSRVAEVVVAYEPLWAIGTGHSATPEMAQEVHQAIRTHLKRAFGTAANDLRIQYGGSVKPDNAAALMAQPDIDGALVGGASLDPASFASIVRAATTQ